MDKTIVIATIGLMILALVAASIFAYYPLQLQIQPVAPPIVFALGSNAGQPDLGSSNTITVTLGTNNTSVNITIHPTYHTTYYKNVTLIKNTDSRAYNVFLVLDDVTNDLPANSTVYLIVYSSGATRSLGTGYPEPQVPSGYVAFVNLTAISTGSRVSIGSLSSGSTWEIDFMVFIPEGTRLTGASATFKMHIAYTPGPGSETPP